MDVEAATLVIAIPIKLVLTVSISTRGSLIASLYARSYAMLSEVIIVSDFMSRSYVSHLVAGCHKIVTVTTTSLRAIARKWRLAPNDSW